MKHMGRGLFQDSIQRAKESGQRINEGRRAAYLETEHYRNDQAYMEAVKSLERADNDLREKYGAQEAETRRRLALLRPRRLPAFGKPILALRKRQLVPFHVVYVCVDCWDWKYADRPRVVIARKDEPYEIDFTILAGLYLIIVWSPFFTRFERVDSIIRECMKVRPAFLHVMNMTHDNDFTVVNSKGDIQIPEYAA